MPRTSFSGGVELWLEAAPTQQTNSSKLYFQAHLTFSFNSTKQLIQVSPSLCVWRACVVCSAHLTLLSIYTNNLL
nr:MAG TPA: hypothetical protein [Caudoviricetes sp.]